MPMFRVRSAQLMTGVLYATTEKGTPFWYCCTRSAFIVYWLPWLPESCWNPNLTLWAPVTYETAVEMNTRCGQFRYSGAGAASQLVPSDVSTCAAFEYQAGVP